MNVKIVIHINVEFADRMKLACKQVGKKIFIINNSNNSKKKNIPFTLCTKFSLCVSLCSYSTPSKSILCALTHCIVGWIDGITINGYKTYHDKRVNPSQSLCVTFSLPLFHHIITCIAPGAHPFLLQQQQQQKKTKIICGDIQRCLVFTLISSLKIVSVCCTAVNSFMVFPTI